MNEFLKSIINRDPAAKSKLSVVLTYPGVKAVFFHRLANFFSVAKFDFKRQILIGNESKQQSPCLDELGISWNLSLV